MKRLLIFGILCAAAVTSAAQTVTVTATKLGGTSPFTGNIVWQATLANGAPTGYQLGGGGQGTSQPFKIPVVSGAFSASLPDTSLTTPAICFSVSAFLKSAGSAGQSSTLNILGPGYSCVQPHYTATSSTDWCQAGVCNFDNYIPQVANPTAVQGTTDFQYFWNSLVADWVANGNPTPSPSILTELSFCFKTGHKPKQRPSSASARER